MAKTSPSLDIIIPTHNNADVIGHTLGALFAQDIPAGWQVRSCISDDGSTDRTIVAIEKMQRSSPWPLTLLRGEHRGASFARNQAIAASSGATILFLGADILLRPGALAAHTAFHEQWPHPQYAALGHVAWDPRLSPPPLMEWLVHGGPQNDFDALLGQDEADGNHYFYGSHLSLKRELLGALRWEEKFTAYGWEDLDLGRRLVRAGLVLKPCFSARGLHRHAYTVDRVIRRQRWAGQGLVAYQRLHPATALAPSITSSARTKFSLLHYSGAIVVLRLLLRYSGKRWTTPRLFFALTTVEYWRGILKAQQRQV